MFNLTHFLIPSRRKSLNNKERNLSPGGQPTEGSVGQDPWKSATYQPESHGTLTLLRVLQAGADGLHRFLYLFAVADIELDGSQAVTL